METPLTAYEAMTVPELKEEISKLQKILRKKLKRSQEKNSEDEHPDLFKERHLVSLPMEQQGLFE